VVLDDEETQTRYVQALHRATKPAARLFMFEFGRHNVNGVQWEGLPSDNFERVLTAGRWRLDYLGTSTYVARFGPETLAHMENMGSNPAWEKRMKPLQDQLAVIGPLLDDYRLHMPIWTVAATRID
jgi:hypothetical protein